MAEVLERSTARVPGIWLLDREKLDDLDSVLDEEWQRLEARRKADVENATRKALREFDDDRFYTTMERDRREARRREIRDQAKDRYPLNRHTRKLVITFRSGKKLTVQRFSEAVNTPSVKDEYPASVLVNLECGRAELVLEMESSLISSGAYVRATPDDLEEARQAFAVCEHWLERNREGWWPRFWNYYFLIAWLIWWLGLMVLAAATSTSGGQERHKAEARALLRGGLKKEDERRATELVLAILSGYEPDDGGRVSRWWFWLPAGIGLFACIALSFPPRTVIGVGKGEASVDRWRQWIRYSVSVPVFLFTSFVVPMIRDQIRFR